MRTDLKALDVGFKDYAEYINTTCDDKTILGRHLNVHFLTLKMTRKNQKKVVSTLRKYYHSKCVQHSCRTVNYCHAGNTVLEMTITF